jgi:hypothetical protein
MLTAGEELAVISKVLGHADYGRPSRSTPIPTRSAPGRIDAARGRTLPAIEDVAT